MQSLPRTARQIRVMALDFSRMNLMHSQKKKKKILKILEKTKFECKVILIIWWNNSEKLVNQLKRLKPSEKSAKSFLLDRERPTQRYNNKLRRIGILTKNSDWRIGIIGSLNLSQVCDVFSKEAKGVLE